MSDLIKEYAGGLFLLAAEEHAEDEIRTQFNEICALFDKKYVRILTDPDIPKSERVGIVDTALRGRVHPYLNNFIRLLTERNLASEIALCCRVYERLYCAKINVKNVTAESAVELDDLQKQKLKEKLEAHTGCKVEIKYVVDKNLLGGMRIVYENKQIDDSVKSKLNEIGGRLSETVI